MPKFTDLPEATDSKDNDVICIVDPDANISKKMTIETLRKEVGVRSFLGGTVAAIPVPEDGDPVTMLDTYSRSGPNTSDPVAGTIGILESGVYKFELTISGQSDFSGNGQGQWNLDLVLRIDDGAGGVVDGLAGSFSSWIKDELVHWTISVTFIEEIVGTPTTTASFGVQVVSGEDADTFDISGTSFFVEKI